MADIQSPLERTLNELIARDMGVPPEKVTLENIRLWRSQIGKSNCKELGHCAADEQIPSSAK